MSPIRSAEASSPTTGTAESRTGDSRTGDSRAGDPEAEFVLSLVRSRPRVPAGIDWDEAVRLLRLRGLDGLAMSAHRSRELLPRRVARALEPAYRMTALHTTLTVESARRARAALSSAGIPSLLYKGAALLEDGTYSDPGARRMDDADLLVSPERADEAVRQLRESGFEPWSPWEPDRVRWLDSVCLTDRRAPAEPREVTLDLHWRVRYGSIRFGEAAGAEPLWEGASPEPGLPAPGPHLLVLAEHVLKHFRVLVHFPGLADLVRVCGRVREWDPVLDRARRHRAAPALGVLLGFLAEEVGAPLPAEALRVGGDGRSGRLARRLLDPVRLVREGSPVEGRVKGLLLRWILAGSARAVAGDLLRTVFPGAGWLRARYGDDRTPIVRLRLRYWRDLLRWATHRGRSPVSPNQEFFE